MKVAITGASGLIGRRLLDLLRTSGHAPHVISRRADTDLHAGTPVFTWAPGTNLPPAGALDADAVVHLAGENVAQRWTAEAKRRIMQSRVEGTRRLIAAIGSSPRRPAALVSASAIGYYGSRGDELLTESSPRGAGFLADVCDAWEREARAAEALGLRVVRLRIGVVLDSGGGALARMLAPFRFGIGGRLGDGRQWMSWIHLDDLAQLFRFAIENPVDGPMNAVAPNPVRNAEFTEALARAMRRPAVLPVPAFALRALFGEMSEVLLGSQRVVPQAAVAAKFAFRYPQLAPALDALLASPAPLR